MRPLLVATLLVGCKSDPKPVSPDPEPPPPSPSTKATRPQRSPEQVLAEIDPGKGFQYFATEGGNHPTIYFDRAAKELVVVGRERGLGGSTKQLARLPAAKPGEALAAYHRQLIQVGYEPHDAPPKPDVDPNQMVAVPMEDIMGGGGPDRAGAFTEVQGEVLYQTAPTAGWVIFSGAKHPTNDYPCMAASGQGLHVLGRDFNQEFPWDKSREAFAAFEKLVSAKR
jgi:hypothetical protein